MVSMGYDNDCSQPLLSLDLDSRNDRCCDAQARVVASRHWARSEGLGPSSQGSDLFCTSRSTLGLMLRVQGI